MSKYIITEGTIFKASSSFGTAIFSGEPQTTIISSINNVKINNKNVCVLGDEQLIRIGYPYTAPPYTTPGSGIIEIISGSFTCYTRDIQINGKNVIVYSPGENISCKFSVLSPASNPAGAVDPIRQYNGFGIFENYQEIVSV